MWKSLDFYWGLDGQNKKQTSHMDTLENKLSRNVEMVCEKKPEKELKEGSLRILMVVVMENMEMVLTAVDAE